MESDPAEIHNLVQRASAGDSEAWGALLTGHRERLHRMIRFRLDRRLQGRLDPSDVIQEAYLEASRHLDRYMQQPTLPFYLWLRGITGNKLLEMHRHHLGTAMRDARREVSLEGGSLMDTTSDALAAQLLGTEDRPSESAIRAEEKARLHQALAEMDPLDREMLALRHFEQLSNAEAAQVIGIQERAAGKRYLRALKRLKEVLASLPDGLSGLKP